MKVSDDELKQIYGDTIFERGLRYFREGRVSQVLKFNGKLLGEVSGTYLYRAEVDIETLRTKCSCPYGINCKHGVATIFKYLRGEYTDGDAIVEKLEYMDKGELERTLKKLVEIDPHTIPKLDLIINKKDSKAIDEEIRRRLSQMEDEPADREFAREFANFIRLNEDLLTKDQIFYILEFLIENCEDFGLFYDDYSDIYFGDEIFEKLCLSFLKKELNDDDFEKLKDLNHKDEYGMLSGFFYTMLEKENAIKLKRFKSHIHELVGDIPYIEFLINCGCIEEAKQLIENSSLHEEVKLKLYSQIDEDEAVKFAEENHQYSALLEYYCKKKDVDRIIEILRELARKEEYWRLKNDFYFLRLIVDSILKSKIEDDGVLRFLYNKCYSQEYYSLCIDIGIALGDKELLKELIDKKPDYHLFRHESKIKLLNYLKDYGEAQKELKRFAESLINQKNNYAYEKAVECAMILREVVGLEEWSEFIEELYKRHSRKTNLWREFRSNGIIIRK